MTTATPASAQTGDTRVALDGLFVQGLKGPVGPDGGRSPTPFAPVADASALFVSLVARSTGLNEAIDRADMLGTQVGVPYANSSQELADEVSPVYFAHESLINQLVQDLSPSCTSGRGYSAKIGDGCTPPSPVSRFGLSLRVFPKFDNLRLIFRTERSQLLFSIWEAVPEPSFCVVAPLPKCFFLLWSDRHAS